MPVPMDRESIRQVLLDTTGLLTVSEGELLCSLAANAGAADIVEIGSYLGGSTVLLSLASHGSKVYAIDPHHGIAPERKPTLDEFLQNLSRYGVEERVVPIVKCSFDAVASWDKPISLLWIDGSHRYKAVKTDFLSWEPHLIQGGVVALHDSNVATNPIPSTGHPPKRRRGPASVVANFIAPNERYGEIATVDSISYATKLCAAD